MLLNGYYKLSDRGLIERTKTDLLFEYFLGCTLKETAINLLDKLIEKTVEVALKEGLTEVKNKLIHISHSNDIRKNNNSSNNN